MTHRAGHCPSADELRALVGEELSDPDRTAVEAHVETCAACQERLERLVSPTHLLTHPPTLPCVGGPSSPSGLDVSFLERLRNSPPSPPASPATDGGVPSQLGPYAILGPLGRGGMGTVYQARHRELDRVVALKVLPADRVDEVAVARFRQEMKAAGRLAHPNIVTAHDAGRVGSTYYLAMDFIDGADLATLVGRRGPLAVADACELVRQAATGLQHACECGLAHRDVKPSNLMLARGGVVKVLDLGLARSLADLPASERLTTSGVLLGTADYIAPEQIDRAHAADARADVYGLGGTLYFLLTGAAPFADRATWWEKLRAHEQAPVPPVRRRRPGVPAVLGELLERMLAKDPADRPATPGEVAAALTPLAEGHGVAALLDGGSGTAPTVRAVRSGAAPTVVERARRSAALRYGLAAGAGALAAILAVAPFSGAGRGPVPGGGTPIPLSGETDAPEAVRLTYGPHGSPRPDNTVLPGERIDLEFVVTGVGRDGTGASNLSLDGEVVDRHDQPVEIELDRRSVRELPTTHFKEPLPRGGSTFTGTTSFVLRANQTPGEYRARVRLTDTVTGRVARLEQRLVVRPPEFAAAGLRLTTDREGTRAAGAHLTVGQSVYVQMHLMNFGHEGEKGRVRISVKLSALGRGGNDILSTPLNPLNIDQNVGIAFNDFHFAAGSLHITQPGEVAIVAEVEDLIGEKKVTYKLPVVVHPPRSIPPPGKE